MAAHMTEEEYRAFKKKTGHREGQKVTTYYKEAEKEKEGLKHHEERRELNRQLRDAGSIPGRFEKAATGDSDITVGVRAGARSVGRTVERIKNNPTVKKVGGFLKERAIGTAHEMQEPESREPARRRGRQSRSRGGGQLSAPMMSLPRDPFGVGNFGGIMSNPYQERRAPPQDAPRKRRRKRQTVHREPRQQGPQMFGLPKGMEWMF